MVNMPITEMPWRDKRGGPKITLVCKMGKQNTSLETDTNAARTIRQSVRRSRNVWRTIQNSTEGQQCRSILTVHPTTLRVFMTNQGGVTMNGVAGRDLQGRHTHSMVRWYMVVVRKKSGDVTICVDLLESLFMRMS